MRCCTIDGSIEIVDVGGSAADFDARRDERLAQGADEVQRRIDDGDVAADALRGERNRAARLEDRAAGAALRFQRERTLRRRRLHRASQGQPAAGRLDAGQGRLVYRCTRRDHEAGGVLIELQRPDAGREAPVEIVPGPAGPEQHVGQPVVVADHAAGDHGNPPRLQLTRPAAEQFCGFAIPVVEARVAAAGDDEIAVEHAAVDRPRQRKLGGEREVPSEPLGGCGERDDLDVGCGEEELLGVSRVEDFVAPQRSDLDAPAHALEFRRVEQGRDVLLQAGEWRV